MKTGDGLGDPDTLGYYKNVKRTVYILGERKSTLEEHNWKGGAILKAGVLTSLKKIGLQPNWWQRI